MPALSFSGALHCRCLCAQAASMRALLMQRAASSHEDAPAAAHAWALTLLVSSAFGLLDCLALAAGAAHYFYEACSYDADRPVAGASAPYHGPDARAAQRHRPQPARAPTASSASLDAGSTSAAKSPRIRAHRPQEPPPPGSLAAGLRAGGQAAAVQMAPGAAPPAPAPDAAAPAPVRDAAAPTPAPVAAALAGASASCPAAPEPCRPALTNGQVRRRRGAVLLAGAALLLAGSGCGIAAGRRRAVDARHAPSVRVSAGTVELCLSMLRLHSYHTLVEACKDCT